MYWCGLIWRRFARTPKKLRRTGVELIAVVKADAYGLGADAVAAAIGDLVDAFYVFDAAEVTISRLRDVAERRVIALLGQSNDPNDYLRQDIRPVVWTVERAAMLKSARPILSVDTGQQRFGCEADDVKAILEAGECDEVMTHATTLGQVKSLLQVMSEQTSESVRADLRFHAAGSALLDEPSAWLDGVRPGMALYRGAARVSARLVEVKDSSGPAGYTGFCVPRFGVILAGYSNGMRVGPCLVNGKERRVVEVGMQSSFVEVDQSDRAGDEVVLLGEGLEAEMVGKAWGSTPQEALVRLCGAGHRAYR